MTTDFTLTTLIAAWMFLFTLTFAYSYTLFTKTQISSYLKCIAGGIILSTMIFHIIPDLYEELSFVAQLSAGVSFLILFVIDKLYLEQAANEDHCEEISKEFGKKIDEEISKEISKEFSKESGECEKNGNDRHVENDDSVEMSECETEKNSNERNNDHYQKYEEYQRYETDNSTEDKSNRLAKQNKDITKPKKHTHNHDTLPQNATIGKAIVFVIALSVHSFLEGLGVPTKKDENLSYYLFGLVGHKWIEAFALGVSVAGAPFRKRTAFLLILFYSSLTPIGILMGSFLMKIDNTVVNFILVGAASGSFFYIGFIEMLNSEFNEDDEKVVRRNKLMAICAGFGIMTIVFKVHEMVGNHNK